jgi:hypothetical protein
VLVANDNSERPITVIDSLMGLGKTTYILSKLREEASNVSSYTGRPRQKLLVIVPLLSEIERYQRALPAFAFKEPSEYGTKKLRKQGHGKKFYDLVRLVEDDENIITTHSLFSKMDRALYAKLQDAGYELIIDEVLETVTLYKGLSSHDRGILFDQRMVSVDPETWRLRWNQEQWGDYDGEFREVKRLCETGSLVVFRERTMLWEFPSEFLRCFSKVTIATYMFDASPFAAYLKNEGFTFNRQTVNGNLTTPSLVPWEDAKPIEAALKARLRELVTVYEGPMNAFGREEKHSHPLSSGWLGRQTAAGLKAIVSSTSYFFREWCNVPTNRLAWTTMKEHRTSLKGRGYTRSKDRKSHPEMREGEAYGFLPWTMQATNDYCEVEAMAFLMNVYYHPDVKAYFEALGGNVSQDLYALSALLQWVWRSKIRRSQPIKLFIPSERMRDLFKRWLAADSTPDLVKEIAGGDITFPLIHGGNRKQRGEEFDRAA